MREIKKREKEVISRHKKQETAEKRAVKEAKKLEARVFVSTDGKWFYLSTTAGAHDVKVVEHVAPVNTRCQHCASDTDSTRASNCTRCSELKNDAHRDRIAYIRYGDLMNIFKKHSDLREEVFHVAVQASIEETQSKAQKREEAEREAKKKQEEERAERKRQRDAQNAHLREHGYKWEKKDVSVYDFDQYEEYDSAYADWQWILYSTDGREVSVEQALDEIERGTSVVLSEIAARKEAARKAKSAEKAKEIAEREAEDRARKEAQVHPMVEQFIFDDGTEEVIYDKEEATSYSRSRYTVTRGLVRGVTAYRIKNYFSGNESTEDFGYYCADPDAANLKRVKRGFFDDFFGV